MYERLDRSKYQVRLLRLLPGHESDDIVCELFTTSLEEPPSYEALSYVWGLEVSTFSIVLGNTLKSVTKNLELALRHLRNDDKARIMWIDALCINQEDLEERRSQVQLMGQVYSSASEVIVWLGPTSNDYEDAIEMIKKLGGDAKLHWNTIAEHEDAAILRLGRAIHNDWWTRIWTVQEAVLAKRLTYQRGRTCLPGYMLANLAKSHDEHFHKSRCCSTSQRSDSIANLSGDLNKVMDNILRLRQLRLMSRDCNFDEVASLFRDREATNPLDKVYGLLGISRGIRDSSIDYTLSKTQAFELATRDCIWYNKNLNILSHVIHNDADEAGYPEILGVCWQRDEPSWVPDWTDGDISPGSDVELIRYRTAFLQHYNACGALELTTSPDHLIGKLHVDGICCDVVGVASKSVLSHPLSREIDNIKAWRKLLRIEMDPNRAYIGGDTVSEAFWRTLCLDIVLPAVPGDGAALPRRAGEDERALYLVYWYITLLDRGYANFNQSDMDFVERFFAFKDHVVKSFTRRKFFISQNGYMGLAPLGTEPGDRICVLAGGKAPFIVRAAQEDEGVASDRFTCRLLGDAYVHGLMDGEAMKLVQQGVAKIEGFELI